MFRNVFRKVLIGFSRIGIAITSTRNLNYLNNSIEEYTRYKSFVNKTLEIAVTTEEFNEMHKLFSDSKSQLFQDIFVLNYLKYRKQGYFVEIGAADGEKFSNTWLLEKNFGWTGILVEPSKIWQEKLHENRIASIDTRAVWQKSGYYLEFAEAAFPELSGLITKLSTDVQTIAKYKVETVSLNELLRNYNAPKNIDYLSIDTEGTEIDILEHFNFNNYNFSFISVEHNYRDERYRIRDILIKNGYQHINPEISDFDDWYALRSDVNR